MNRLELRAERIRKGKTCKDMAAHLGLKTADSYCKREQGAVSFKDGEILAVAKALDLGWPKINVIFFDGKLPDG